jgi:hypothetical protein
VRKIYRNGSHCWSNSLLCRSLSLWLLGGVTTSLVTGLCLCGRPASLWQVCVIFGRGLCLEEDVRVRMNVNGVDQIWGLGSVECEWG